MTGFPLAFISFLLMIIFIQSLLSGNIKILLNMIFFTLFLIFPLILFPGPMLQWLFKNYHSAYIHWNGLLDEKNFFSFPGISSPLSHPAVQIQTVPRVSLPPWSLSHTTSWPAPSWKEWLPAVLELPRAINLNSFSETDLLLLCV